MFPVSKSLIILLVVALGLAWYAGSIHDYRSSYLVGWHQVMDGHEPWGKTNGAMYSYGPAFNLFAPLAALHDLAPKMVFVLFWVAIVAWYDRLASRTGSLPPTRWKWIRASLVFNPLIWLEIVHFGHFDVVLAALVLASLRAQCSGSWGQTGFWVGCGTLLKFYPAVTLPALALQDGRVRIRVMTAFGRTLLLGFGVAFLVWGRTVFDPLIFADARPSKLLSIFRFLRGRFSPTPNLDEYSGVVLLIALGVLLFFLWRRRPPVLIATAVSLLTLFTFYRAGHVQYLVVLFFVAPLVAMEHWEAISRDRLLQWAALVYGGWITLYQILYYLLHEFSRPPYDTIREVSGAINFPLAILLVWCVFRVDWRVPE